MHCATALYVQDICNTAFKSGVFMMPYICFGAELWFYIKSLHLRSVVSELVRMIRWFSCTCGWPLEAQHWWRRYESLTLLSPVWPSAGAGSHSPLPLRAASPESPAHATSAPRRTKQKRKIREKDRGSSVEWFIQTFFLYLFLTKKIIFRHLRQCLPAIVGIFQQSMFHCYMVGGTIMHLLK